MSPSDPLFTGDPSADLAHSQPGQTFPADQTAAGGPGSAEPGPDAQSLALELMGRMFHIQCDPNSRDRIRALAARLNLRFQAMHPLPDGTAASEPEDPFAQMAFIALQLENDLDMARRDGDIMRHACETALARIGILSEKLDEMSQ